MAKAPKAENTKAGKLRQLRALGLTDHKTFSKSAERVWSDFISEFPNGKAPKNATFITASAEARKACASVNMRVIGNAVMFPTPAGGVAKIRETKHGVFVDYGRKGGTLDSIILSKKGDHLKYGMKLAKREYARQLDREENSVVWGTLKTHAFKATKDGKSEMINGFMRDVARAHEDPLNAVFDDRYANNKLSVTQSEVQINDKFVDLLQQTNGTAALIRVNW